MNGGCGACYEYSMFFMQIMDGRESMDFMLQVLLILGFVAGKRWANRFSYKSMHFIKSSGKSIHEC